MTNEYNANKSNFKGAKMAGNQTNFTTVKGRSGFIVEDSKKGFTLGSVLKCMLVIVFSVVLFEVTK